MMIDLKKVVIPVAAWAQECYRQQGNSKEMLPIIDKPIIQYVIEEVISAGFKK